DASRGHSVHTPSRAAVSEIMAPAGSDMQILPPTLAMFQILKDMSSALQHSVMSGTAVQCAGPVKACSAAMRQVAAISSPSPEALSAGHSSASRSMSVSVDHCGSEKSQVPPASQA